MSDCDLDDRLRDPTSMESLLLRMGAATRDGLREAYRRDHGRDVYRTLVRETRVTTQDIFMAHQLQRQMRSGNGSASVRALLDTVGINAKKLVDDLQTLRDSLLLPVSELVE